MNPFAVEYEDEALRVASRGNLFVNVWSGALTVARLDALHRCECELRKRHPEGFAIASVVASMPTELLKLEEPARKRADAISKEMTPHTVALADVVLGGGFWAAAVRSIMVGVNLVTRPAYPKRSFDTLGTAAAWLTVQLERRSPGRWSAVAVEDALRRAVEGRGAA